MSARIYQLANKIGITNKKLLSLLQDRGFMVKSASSQVDHISAEALLEEFGDITDTTRVASRTNVSLPPSNTTSQHAKLVSKECLQPQLTMTHSDDVNNLVAHCRNVLPLSEARLSQEYFYASLPLCVIDSVFSIGVRYASTRNVVIKYCERFELPRIREDFSKYPTTNNQHRISDFLENFDQLGVDEMTQNVFQNKQRTSSRNGTLKSEAAYTFAKLLKKHQIEDFEQLQAKGSWTDLEKDIRLIKGQSSGISFQYFLMLAGNESFIKPDRMILRFLECALSRHSVSLQEAQALLQRTAEILRDEYDFNTITPRLLDHTIWNYQRANTKAKADSSDYIAPK